MSIHSPATSTWWVNGRRSVQSRAARIPGMVGALKASPRGGLGAFEFDIESTLDYIESLPGEARKAAMYNLFAIRYNHYLPKQLIWHYVYCDGANMKLPVAKMIDCNAVISLAQSNEFQERLIDLHGQGRDTEIRMNFAFQTGALRNGTLGNFTVFGDCKLVVRSNGQWTAIGTMEFFDIYDFDLKDFATGNRTVWGEVQTRIGHYGLPGRAYNIVSERASFTQTETDLTVQWAGGRTKEVLDYVQAHP